MRNRKNARYFDRVGPTILCVAMFVAVALNLAFELWDRGMLPFGGEGTRVLVW